MLGVEDYGSDSDDETTISTSRPSGTHSPLASASTTPSVKSGLNLPPPISKAGKSSANSSLSLPPPKSKGTTSAVTQKKTKKILIDLPKLSKGSDDEDDAEYEKPAAKRPRTGGGASALLSMLPAPKKSANEVPESKQERVLGSGSRRGLVFTSSAASIPKAEEPDLNDNVQNEDGMVEQYKEETTTTMLPPSLLKGKGKGKGKDASPAMDFFSLGKFYPALCCEHL
jgi:hypothetical protein